MSRLPETGPSLSRWLRQQERKAQRQQDSSAFARSGVRVVAEGVSQVDGTLSVVGDLDVSGNAAFDGNTTIGGNAAITGTLSLPAGIIDNAALASPVKPQSVYSSDSSFGLSTTTTVMKSVTITVPAGFTSAVVSLTSRVYAINPNTTGGSNGLGADWIYSKTVIDGSAPVMLPQAVGGSNGSGINVAPNAAVLTGLTPGGTFVISADARSGALAWATNASNFVDLSGSIHWFR